MKLIGKVQPKQLKVQQDINVKGSEVIRLEQEVENLELLEEVWSLGAVFIFPARIHLIFPTLVQKALTAPPIGKL